MNPTARSEGCLPIDAGRWQVAAAAKGARMDMDNSQTVEAMHMVLKTLRLLRPHRVPGLNKIRVGRFFDGGYVMLDSFDNISAAYSLGINDDVSWDLDIANRGIEVFQYDHTIEKLPREHPLFHWSRLGISDQPDDSIGLDTIANLIQKNGHEDSDNLLLKCDIEGYEWQVFANIPSDVLSKFKQIVIELHGFQRLADMKFANLVRTALFNLSTSHRVTHVHANNFAPWASVGGVPVPSVLEVSLARLDHGAFTVSDEVFPTPLDMPCHSKEADLYLGRFAFD
jgi:hypothetical protein